MFKKILISSLALGTLALGAPAAQADDPQFACNFRAVQQQDATGQNFEGAAFGYVAHPGDGTATIRCFIAVNDSEVTSTPESTPTPAGVSATAGRLTYFAGETDVVTFHAEVCTSHGCFVHDYETVRQQIPPQEVIDLLISVIDTIDAILIGIEKDVIDPIVCPILIGLEGDYAPLPIVINDQGDVFIAGEAFWDCPPYDIFG